MSRFQITRSTVVMVISCFASMVTMLFCVVVVGQEKPVKSSVTSSSSDDVFGLTRVWKIHLHVTADAWKTMQPATGGFPGFGPPPGPPRPGPQFRPGSFGYEFDYVKADVELDGQVIREVGLRFKGNGTYMMSAATKKRPFKLDFDRYVSGQEFHGLRKLNLLNNVMDPTNIRQTLSFPVFQAAGVPSPRTAYADVSLTIDGECDHEPLGVYSMVEEIDKSFLRRHYQTDKGMLLKPAGTQGLEYKGENWSDYAWFEPKWKPSKEESQRLIDVTRLIEQADDETFRREIGQFIELDEFAGFLAANTLLANMDSFLTQVHNYYVYLSPKTNKFVFFPWDLDLSMGAFFFAGSAEQLQDLSISHPHSGENKLIERLLAWETFNEQYRQRLRTLTTQCFGVGGATIKSIPVIQAAVKSAVDAEAKRAALARQNANSPPGTPRPGFPGPGFPGPGIFGGQPPLETFIAKRRESVLSQLDGKSKGTLPGMAFGPPPGGPGGPGPGRPGGDFGPGNFHAPQFIEAGDRDDDEKLSPQEFATLGGTWFKEWDKNKDGILTGEELVEGLNKSLGPPADAPGGFKPPAGFGPGMFLGPPLTQSADSNKDEKVSKEEWTALFASWFKKWDKNEDKLLDNAELISGLNSAFIPRQFDNGPSEKKQ